MKKALLLLLTILITDMTCHVIAQPEVMAWGNMTGIRIEGQLMEFESSLRVMEKNWSHFTATVKERQQLKYDCDGHNGDETKNPC
jgi:hypothetical protein